MSTFNEAGWKYLTKLAPDKDTWLNVHHKLVFTDGRAPIYPGTAHSEIATGLSDAMFWALSRGRDVYLAQGMYRNPGDHRPNMPYPNAFRQEPNLVACKAFYIDVDVKAGGYASTKEAATAMKAFLAAARLPAPTIIVTSGGGGMHVYWTIDEAFEPRVFRHMAGQLVAAGVQHGLLFDRQCTSDPLRLLRIPGTYNFKGGENVEGKPVKLIHCADHDIKLDDMKAALEPYKTVSVLRPNSKSNGPSLNDDLMGGMKREYPPVEIDEVAQDCPFIKETLEQGGANLVGDAQWHQMAALACHTTEPSKTVHRLCEKGVNYSYEATEEKLGASQRARENRETIGPPKCDKIAVGAPHCAICPHLALNTTPLALPFKRPNSRAYNSFVAASPTGNGTVTDMPEGYYRGGDQLIWTAYYNEKSGQNDDVLAFEHSIIPGSASIEAGKPSYMLTFDTIQGEERVTKRFPTTFVSGNAAFMDAMNAEGLAITGKPDEPRKFMQNFLKLLASKRGTLIRVPAFGWAQDHSGQWGFAYAGKFYSPAGEYKAGTPGEGVENYKVSGDDAGWTGLTNIVLTNDRPDLACMVASSFAAPLIYMTGENGVLVGWWSTESGIGKSTALALAQSVWAKPTLGGLTDTVNYTFAKCATLRHLPIIYDEIKGEKPTKAMVELVFQLTRGSEKGRSSRTGEMKIVREFETLCAYASNSSIVDEVREIHQGTDADWLRIFEMQSIALKSNNANFNSEVKERLLSLKLNYGGIGQKYAQYLGLNQAKIQPMLMKYQNELVKQLGADPQVERFWLGAMAAMLLGARIANMLHFCTFPLAEMKQYLFAEYHRMKGEMLANPSDLGTDEALKNTMGVFLTEKLPRNLIILNKTAKAGRPTKNFAMIRNMKASDHAWGVIEVQVSGDPYSIRISDHALGEWCKKTNRPKSALVAQLKKKVGAVMRNVSLGSGTHLAAAKQNSWVIEVAGTIFEDILESAIHHDLLP